MALNLMLRRASSSVIPRSIRAVGSQIASQGAIAAALYLENSALVPRGLLPVSRFSSATAEKERADKKLIRVLEDEIDSAEQEPKEVDDFPKNFPFEIHDTPGERTVLLSRKYEGEVIKVEVDMPNVDIGEDGNMNDDDASAVSSIPLVVSISKNGECLKFCVTAFPDEVTIESLLVKAPEGYEEQLAYEGPDFGDLDENLQKAFHKYLEVRGIRPSTTNFLFEYMQKKDSKEYYQWLHNLKNFMEK